MTTKRFYHLRCATSRRFSILVTTELSPNGPIVPPLRDRIAGMFTNQFPRTTLVPWEPWQRPFLCSEEQTMILRWAHWIEIKLKQVKKEVLLREHFCSTPSLNLHRCGIDLILSNSRLIHTNMAWYLMYLVCGRAILGTHAWLHHCVLTTKHELVLNYIN